MRIQRQSGIELLRLVAMLGIVLSHWGGHGSWELSTDNAYLANKVFLQLTQFLGEVGNCIFFLITGYFSYNRDSVNKKGLLRLVIDTKFHSLWVWIAVLLIGVYDFSIGGLVKSLFPIVMKQYWFVLPFIVVCLIAPWINQIIKNSDSKTLKWYFGLLIMIEMVLPLIGATTVSSNVGLFILIYSIGATLKKEERFLSFVTQNKYLLLIGGYGGGILFIAATDLFVARFQLNPVFSMILTDRFSFLPSIAAISLFVIFLNIHFYNRIVNHIAQSVLSVYLISEHPYVHPWFWKTYFDNMEFYSTWYMIPVAILQCMIVMAVCVAIDMLYRIIRDNIMKKITI